MNAIKELGHLPPNLTCLECDSPLFQDSDTSYLFINYLKGRKDFQCNNCKKIMNIKKLVLHTIKGAKHSRPTMVLGFKTSVYVITIKKDEVYTFDLDMIDFPRDALIAYIQYTPAYNKDMEGLKPIDITEKDGNRIYYSRINKLYPMIGSNKNINETEICVAVFWIPNASSDVSWQQMNQSLMLYEHNDYMQSLISANIAVEIKLEEIIDKILSNVENISNAHKNGFMRNVATYSHQLNVLLPLIASLKGFPILDDDIRGQLNSLRDNRNKIAHTGKAKIASKADAAELLVAAVFGLQYLRLIDQLLTSDTML